MFKTKCGRCGSKYSKKYILFESLCVFCYIKDKDRERESLVRTIKNQQHDLYLSLLVTDKVASRVAGLLPAIKIEREINSIQSKKCISTSNIHFLLQLLKEYQKEQSDV